MSLEHHGLLKRSGLLLAGLLVVSCTANRMHRPVSVEEFPDYSLAFIEFDDQGELWAPSQLERALALIDSRNRPDSGLAVVLFVHGWNDSASIKEEKEGKGKVSGFRQLLTLLSHDLKRRHPEFDVPVVGLYLSWRGEVSSAPLVRQLSFYNRRGAAERIAGASATEAIYRILTATRNNPYARSVLIGHSFGSMILERALAQAVVSALLASPGHELIFPADLVVLFNPAGSASQTKQLVDILGRNRLKTYRYDENGNRVERPLLVSFTSEDDTATRRYFPAGMSFKALNKKFRAYGEEYCSAISNQRWLYTHTAGHTPALHSHSVTAGPKPDRRDSEPDTDSRLTYETGYDPSTQQVAFSFDGQDHRFTIQRKPRALNDTPYWIMQVPRELIPNHSQIFSADTYTLVESVLELSGTLGQESGTVVVREDGVRPVAVVPRRDGSVFFLDRSRALYAVRDDWPRPVFLSCLDESIDPADGIGFHVEGDLAHVALVRREPGPTPKCQTEIHEFEIHNGGYRSLSRVRLTGTDCFRAAAFDAPNRRAYLSLESPDGPALFVADLSDETRRPEKLVDLPGTMPATVLRFDTSGRRLFAAQSETGELWEIDVEAETPRTRVVANNLGWPTSLGFAPGQQRLYVTDAKQKKIWALDCRDRCGDPTNFLESDSLVNPTTLAIAADGRLWLGDRQSQTLMAIAPDGSIERVVHTFSGSSLGDDP